MLKLLKNFFNENIRVTNKFVQRKFNPNSLYDLWRNIYKFLTRIVKNDVDFYFFLGILSKVFQGFFKVISSEKWRWFLFFLGILSKVFQGFFKVISSEILRNGFKSRVIPQFKPIKNKEKRTFKLTNKSTHKKNYGYRPRRKSLPLHSNRISLQQYEKNNNKNKEKRKTITTNSLKLKRSGSPDVAHVALSLQWSVQK